MDIDKILKWLALFFDHNYLSGMFLQPKNLERPGSSTLRRENYKF